MSESISAEEHAAAEEKVQEQGIEDMVKALSIGPVESKDGDKDKDKDEDKDKDKDKDEDGGKDDEDKDESNGEEDEDEDGEDKDEDEDDDDKDKDEDVDKDKDKDEDKDEEDEDKDKEDEDEEDKEEEEEEDEDEDEDEDSDLKLQLEILKAENEALKVGTKVDAKPEDQLGVTNIKDLEDVDFLGDEEGVEELASTKEGLNKILNAVRSKTIQEMMVTLPNLAAGLVTQRANLEKAVEKFYDDNKDFKQHKDYVSLVAQKVQSDHPGLSYETMFKLVEKKVRKNLNLKKKVDTIRDKEDKKGGKKGGKRTDESKPALSKKGAGGGGSARGSKDTRTVEQKDMDSMLKTVG